MSGPAHHRAVAGIHGVGIRGRGGGGVGGGVWTEHMVGGTVCVCMHACAHVCECACVYALCVYVHACVHVCVCACMCMYESVFILTIERHVHVLST